MIKLVKLFKKSCSTINLKQRFRLTALFKMSQDMCLFTIVIFMMILISVADIVGYFFSYAKKT